MIPKQSHRLKKFLTDEKLLPDVKAGQKTLARLVQTLADTVDRGKLSSIKMIDTKLKVDKELSDQFCVIDAGGTRLRMYHLQREVQQVKKTQPAREAIQVKGYKGLFKLETCVEVAMPGTGPSAVEIGRDAFIQELVKNLIPIIKKIEQVERAGGRAQAKQSLMLKFSFSYPAAVDEDEEVRPVEFTKEIKANQLIGFPLRGALIKGLRSAGVSQPISLTILNDTVAVYLAGVLKTQENEENEGPLEKTYEEKTEQVSEAESAPNVNVGDSLVKTSSLGATDEARLKIASVSQPLASQPVATTPIAIPTAVMGVVYGTGFNICYQDVSVQNGEQVQTIFNTEIGGYDGFSMTAMDTQLDNHCDDPGEALAEKRISGSYVCRFFKEALIRLSECRKERSDTGYGFSEQTLDFFQTLRTSKVLPTNPELATFLKTRELDLLKTCTLSTDELTFLQELLEVIAWRSAYHGALLTAGIALRMLKVQPVRQLMIALEGGFVQHFPRLLEIYERYVKEWLANEDVTLRIVFMENAVPVGATLAKWQSD